MELTNLTLEQCTALTLCILPVFQIHEGLKSWPLQDQLLYPTMKRFGGIRGNWPIGISYWHPALKCLPITLFIQKLVHFWGYEDNPCDFFYCGWYSHTIYTSWLQESQWLFLVGQLHDLHVLWCHTPIQPEQHFQPPN